MTKNERIKELEQDYESLEKRIEDIEETIGIKNEYDLTPFYHSLLISDMLMSHKPLVSIKEELKLIKKHLGIELVNKPKSIEVEKVKKTRKKK